MKIFVYFIWLLLVFVTATRCVHCEVFIKSRVSFLYSLFIEVRIVCYLPLCHNCLHFMIVFKFVAAHTLLHRCRQVVMSRR
jgi:hypothetical protein